MCALGMALFAAAFGCGARVAWASPGGCSSVVLATAAAPTAPASAAPARGGASLRLLDSTVVAGDDFLWPIRLVIINQGDTGLYTDSLVCAIENLDPGIRESDRHRSVPLPAAAKLAAS